MEKMQVALHAEFDQYEMNYQLHCCRIGLPINYHHWLQGTGTFHCHSSLLDHVLTRLVQTT